MLRGRSGGQGVSTWLQGPGSPTAGGSTSSQKGAPGPRLRQDRRPASRGCRVQQDAAPGWPWGQFTQARCLGIRAGCGCSVTAASPL